MLGDGKQYNGKVLFDGVYFCQGELTDGFLDAIVTADEQARAWMHNYIIEFWVKSSPLVKEAKGHQL